MISFTASPQITELCEQFLGQNSNVWFGFARGMRYYVTRRRIIARVFEIYNNDLLNAVPPIRSVSGSSQKPMIFLRVLGALYSSITNIFVLPEPRYAHRNRRRY